MPFGWLLSVTPTPYLCWKCTTLFTPTFSGTELGRKARAGCIKFCCNAIYSSYSCSCVHLFAEISFNDVSLFIFKIPVHLIIAYDGVGVQLHSFLIVVPDGRAQSASCPRHFTPGEYPPIPIEWEARGPQGRYGRFGKEITHFSLPVIELQFLRCSARSLVIIVTTLSQLSPTSVKGNFYQALPTQINALYVTVAGWTQNVFTGTPSSRMPEDVKTYKTSKTTIRLKDNRAHHGRLEK